MLKLKLKTRPISKEKLIKPASRAAMSDYVNGTRAAIDSAENEVNAATTRRFSPQEIREIDRPDRPTSRAARVRFPARGDD